GAAVLDHPDLVPREAASPRGRSGRLRDSGSRQLDCGRDDGRALAARRLTDSREVSPMDADVRLKMVSLGRRALARSRAETGEVEAAGPRVRPPRRPRTGVVLAGVVGAYLVLAFAMA